MTDNLSYIVNTHWTKHVINRKAHLKIQQLLLK